MILTLSLAVGHLCQLVISQRNQPNIIFILADDLGWNDVSWHNPAMPTANMERLAMEGLRLEQAYSQQVCTPSRAALLTGKYPFHIGRQKRALKPFQPTGLMTNLTTLPQQLKELGYSTHMVGKWHLGYCAWEYTPTRRGFDTFLGFYLGAQNHFSHDRDYKRSHGDPPTFYDFRENEEVAEQYKGEYSTDLFKKRSIDIIEGVADARELNAYGNYDPFFLYLSLQAPHAPLQARAEILSKIPQSSNPARDIYKAMLYDVDIAIDEIVKSLKDTNLYNDTIIVVTSDNGGAISHGASNYPLRGTKGTLFEGGTRVPTFLLGPPHLLPRQQEVSQVLVHISDWMPTLLKMAGYEGNPSKDLQLDGVDQSQALRTGLSVRQEMVYNLRNHPLSGAFRRGPYKIIFGQRFNKQGWYDTDNTALQCSRMVRDKKEKRKELKKNKEKSEGKRTRSKRKGRIIELVTSKKIEKILSAPNYNRRGNRRKRKKKKEILIKRKNKKRKNKKNKGKKKGNKRKKLNGRKNKDNGRGVDRNNDKIVMEIFEDKHYDFDMINKSINNKMELKSSRSRSRKEKNRRKEEEDLEAKVSRSRGRKEKRRKMAESQEEDLEEKDSRSGGRNERKRRKEERDAEKILNKMWQDWIPEPGPEIQNTLRLRMKDCDWAAFSDQGHSEDIQLIPRSALQFGDIVQIIDPVLNPFNISAEDEDNEFEEEMEARLGLDEDLEHHFANLDIAMFNVIDDPEETTDLREQFPEIFEELKERVLVHVKNIVPEDFPELDISAHPRNFDNNFSPGWCSAM